jgi:hypothetical protein
MDEERKKTTEMRPILTGCGGVHHKLINRRVEISPVLFTRNLSFKKKA